jgi:hypothetical protein
MVGFPALLLTSPLNATVTSDGPFRHGCTLGSYIGWFAKVGIVATGFSLLDELGGWRENSGVASTVRSAVTSSHSDRTSS